MNGKVERIDYIFSFEKECVLGDDELFSFQSIISFKWS